MITKKIKDIKIWVLFSIENEYDQPRNNMVAWWWAKPTFQILANVMKILFNKEKGNAIIGRIFKGEKVRHNNADFRLREIREGRIKQ